MKPAAQPMRALRGRRAAWVFVLLLALAPGLTPAGQQQQQPRTPNPLTQHPGLPWDRTEDPDTELAERQLRALNADRQRSLVADANKLVKLARELNTEIEASNSASLTPYQLQKINDIEKLARNIRQKMSYAMTATPSYQPPPPPPMQ